MSSFGLPLATWWQRFGSMLLDIVILAIPTVIVAGVALGAMATTTTTLNANGALVRTRDMHGGATALLWLVVYLIQGLYFAALNGSARGQTVGNRAPGIAVRDAVTGGPIGFWRGALRWVVRAVLYLCLGVPGLLNDLWPLWDSQRQTLADKAARTVMVKV
jgi:uncharacterized RDD family membrane protein YckC